MFDQPFYTDSRNMFFEVVFKYGAKILMRVENGTIYCLKLDKRSPGIRGNHSIRALKIISDRCLGVPVSFLTGMNNIFSC